MSSTTFFDLPIEIRDKIWRRARFLFALNNIRQNLKIQIPQIKEDNQYCKVISIQFQLDEYKIMIIENIVYNDYNYNDVLVVDIADSNYIKVLILPLSDSLCQKVDVVFGFNYSKRSFIYRKVNIDSKICKYFYGNELCLCNYRNTIDIDTILPDTI